MEQRVSCVTLGVSDLPASAAFYESLGWKRVASSTASIIVFDLLGASLSLFPKQRLSEDIGPLAAAPAAGFSGITLAHNVHTKEEVAPILEKVKVAGGTILKEASSAFWGGWHGYFTDLDGHVWEVCFNPYAPLRKDGAFRWDGYHEDEEKQA